MTGGVGGRGPAPRGAGRTGPTGSWNLGAVGPPGAPPGIGVWMLAWIPDPVAAQGYAASNGVKLTTP